MTRRARGLLAVYDKALVEVNPDDALRLGLDDKKPVSIKSRRGEIEATAWITDRVPPGMVFANFHFPGDQNANVLTIAALDPVAKIPVVSSTCTCCPQSVASSPFPKGCVSYVMLA